MVQAHFTKYAGWKNIVKSAFVQLVLQENGYPIQYKPLTIQTIPYRFQPQQSTHSRSAQILRKNIAKTPRSRRHERPILPIMKNVRYPPNNPTETRTIPARTQKAKPYSELGISDLYRILESYIPVSPRQQICPAAAETPRGQERCWRGIGDRNPLSLSNRPREE